MICTCLAEYLFSSSCSVIPSFLFFPCALVILLLVSDLLLLLLLAHVLSFSPSAVFEHYQCLCLFAIALRALVLDFALSVQKWSPPPTPHHGQCLSKVSLPRHTVRPHRKLQWFAHVNKRRADDRLLQDYADKFAVRDNEGRIISREPGGRTSPPTVIMGMRARVCCT